MELTCCFMEDDGSRIPCAAPAEWELVDGPSPDSATYSCDRHVWQMVTDAPRIAISSYPVAEWQYTLTLDRSPTPKEERS